MNRRTNTVITTACVGAVIGTAAYVMSSNRTTASKAKRFKKSTGKALRQVGDFIDNVSYMMR